MTSTRGSTHPRCKYGRSECKWSVPNTLGLGNLLCCYKLFSNKRNKKGDGLAYDWTAAGHTTDVYYGTMNYVSGSLGSRTFEHKQGMPPVIPREV